MFYTRYIFSVSIKEGQFDIVELIVNNQFKALKFGLEEIGYQNLRSFKSINSNAQHVNGLTRLFA